MMSVQKTTLFFAHFLDSVIAFYGKMSAFFSHSIKMFILYLLSSDSPLNAEFW